MPQLRAVEIISYAADLEGNVGLIIKVRSDPPDLPSKVVTSPYTLSRIEDLLNWVWAKGFEHGKKRGEQCQQPMVMALQPSKPKKSHHKIKA